MELIVQLQNFAFPLQWNSLYPEKLIDTDFRTFSILVKFTIVFNSINSDADIYLEVLYVLKVKTKI